MPFKCQTENEILLHSRQHPTSNSDDKSNSWFSRRRQGWSLEFRRPRTHPERLSGKLIAKQKQKWHERSHKNKFAIIHSDSSSRFSGRKLEMLTERLESEAEPPSVSAGGWRNLHFYSFIVLGSERASVFWRRLRRALRRRRLRREIKANKSSRI